jgi:HrpA-like RNA helicase
MSATLQTLTQQLKTLTDEEICDKYQFILIDECHERSRELDLTMYILKNFIGRNAHKPNCPFVCLMSATFDEKVFLGYFGLPRANFISVEGSAYNRDFRWMTKDSENYNEDIAKTVKKIVEEGKDDVRKRGDVIVFLPSSKNPDLRIMLEDINKELINKGKSTDVFNIIQISSDAQAEQSMEFLSLDNIPLDDQEVVIDGVSYTPRRRVILSTNVAETGLTLEELKYIIDAGFNQETEFNPILGLEYLAKKPAPQSRITQRIGRVGRKFDGVYYPIYPKAIFDKLQVNQYPDILTNNITNVLLDVLLIQMKTAELLNPNSETHYVDISNIDLLDVPSPDSMRFSLERLYSLGLLAPINDGLTITDYGKQCSAMLCPALNSLESCRMILAGFTWQVSVLDLITIAAYLNINYSKDFKKVNWQYIYKTGLPTTIAGTTKSYHNIRAIIGDQFIEALILFNSFNSAILAGNTAGWYENTLISERIFINDFLNPREAIIEQCLNNELDIFRNEGYGFKNIINHDIFFNYLKNVKHCIYDGYRNNLIKYDSDSKKYYSRATEVKEPALFYVDRENNKESLRKGKYMVYKALELGRAKKGIKLIEAPIVSVMDGYVGVDETYLV